MKMNSKRLLSVLLALVLMLSLIPAAFAEGELPVKGETPEGFTPVKRATRDDGEEEMELVAGFYFEDEDCDDWTFVDADGDGLNWKWSNDFATEFAEYAYEGEGFLLSQSYVNNVGAYDPDNWAISPAIELPDGAAKLSFYMASCDGDWPDTFAAYVGLSDDIDEMDEVVPETLVEGGKEWQQFVVDLEDYLGEEIYVAIRHFDSEDNYQLWLDAVEIFGEEGEGGSGSVTVADGETTNNYVPVYGLYADDYQESQIIYPASMLADMNNNLIKSLTFYASQNTDNWQGSEFEVYFLETDATELVAGDGFVPLSTMTKVMDQTALHINGGKMTVTLDNPYTYHGGNLLVAVVGVNPVYYSSSYWYGVTVDGASINGYSGAGVESIMSIAQRNFIPKTTFAYEEVGIPVTITAENKTKGYGAEDPELTVVVEGVDDDVQLKYTVYREEGEDAGEYAIKIKLGKNKGYTITKVEGVFKIEKATPELLNVAATPIYNGEPLSDSIISGMAINPNNNKEVPGVWAFDEPDYYPEVADSETKDFGMTFTPEDTWNFEPVSMNLKLVVYKPLPTVVEPTVKELFYNGEAQELVNPGSAEGGTMLYSLDGVNYSEEVPTATELGSYLVWFYVAGDEDHSDTAPKSLLVTIYMTINGMDTETAMIAFVENGERLYRYDVTINNIPDGLKIYAAQVFMEYDPDAFTVRRIETTNIDWTVGDKDGKLMFAWASDSELELTNGQVLFSLILSVEGEPGTAYDLPFIANSLGYTSTVSVLKDGRTADLEALTIDGKLLVTDPIWGDANGDGIVTAADAATILRALVGLDQLSPVAAFNADVNGDLQVTAEDAALILRYIVGMVESLPVEP